MKGREFFHLVVKELRDVLRDRRAAFFTFVFPVLLYPILFVISKKVRDLDEFAREEQSVRVGLYGEYGTFLRSEMGIRDSDRLHVVRDVPLRARLLETEEFDVLVSFDQPREGETTVVRVLYDGALPLSREGYRRVTEVIERFRLGVLAQRFATRGVLIPGGELLEVESTDTASLSDRATLAVARFLPVVLLLLFFTGGAFAAMDLVAGEKERGTLETLLVHPVSASVISSAKFTVVVACSFGSVLLNLAGMAFAHRFQGVVEGLSLPSPAVCAVIVLALVPLAILTSSLLLAISTRARSFREAQTYLVPVMILGILPALVAAMPNVELGLLTACIPISNVSLAVRDAVLGDLNWLWFGVAFVSTSAYAGLAIRWSAGLLSREDVILGPVTEAVTPETRGRNRARRATWFALGVLLLLYYSASSLQSPDGPFGPYWGLALTLWVFVLVPALVYPLFAGTSLTEAWALRRARLGDLGLALLAVPAVAVIITAYMEIQATVLPFPAGLEESFRQILGLESLSPLLKFALFALSPAICEELLWRGTVQGELERGGRPLRTIALIALFFGLFHLSIYRFVPTAATGAFLAFLRWRTGSILPSMLFHLAYNGLLVLVLAPLHEAGDSTVQAFTHPLSVVAAVGVLVLCTWGIRGAGASRGISRRRRRIRHRE